MRLFEDSFSKIDRRDLVFCFSISLFLFLLSMLWFSLDHHHANQDESGHILNSISFMELFLEPRPFRGYWWNNLFSVNNFYPPFVYILSGLMKCVLGIGRWVDIFVASVFTFWLAASSFLTVRILGFSVLSACLAALLVNLFPSAAALNHSFMLDYPLLSMVSVGIFSICFWRQKPTLLRALASGVLLGLSCLTKQIAAVYLVGTGALFVIESLISDRKEARFKELIQLFVMALTTAVVAGPFVVYSYKATKTLTDTIKAEMSSGGASRSFVDYFGYYVTQGFPAVLSYFFFALFILAGILVGAKVHRKLLPVWFSFAVGVLAMSSWTDFPISTRYIIPALTLPAYLIGIFLANLFESRKRFYQLLASISIAVAVALYISFNFCPYPISGPSILVNLAPSLGAREPDQLSRDKNHRAPQPYQDWGYEWTLDQIEKWDKGVPIYLNILANSYEVNAHTYELLTKERKSQVRATTSRYHTVVGDKIDFSPEKALYYHWYLRKDGDLGWPLADQASRDNEQKLNDFLDNSGKFRKVATKVLPDGATLTLYRQKF